MQPLKKTRRKKRGGIKSSKKKSDQDASNSVTNDAQPSGALGLSAASTGTSGSGVGSGVVVGAELRRGLDQARPQNISTAQQQTPTPQGLPEISIPQFLQKLHSAAPEIKEPAANAQDNAASVLTPDVQQLLQQIHSAAVRPSNPQSANVQSSLPSARETKEHATSPQDKAAYILTSKGQGSNAEDSNAEGSDAQRSRVHDQNAKQEDIQAPPPLAPTAPKTMPRVYNPNWPKDNFQASCKRCARPLTRDHDWKACQKICFHCGTNGHVGKGCPKGPHRVGWWDRPQMMPDEYYGVQKAEYATLERDYNALRREKRDEHEELLKAREHVITVAEDRDRINMDKEHIYAEYMKLKAEYDGLYSKFQVEEKKLHNEKHKLEDRMEALEMENELLKKKLTDRARERSPVFESAIPAAYRPEIRIRSPPPARWELPRELSMDRLFVRDDAPATQGAARAQVKDEDTMMVESAAPVQRHARAAPVASMAPPNRLGARAAVPQRGTGNQHVVDPAQHMAAMFAPSVERDARRRTHWRR